VRKGFTFYKGETFKPRPLVNACLAFAANSLKININIELEFEK
jgi:hypothetical protein